MKDPLVNDPKLQRKKMEKYRLQIANQKKDDEYDKISLYGN